MRPLRAVVLSVNKKTGLEAKTETGLIVNLSYSNVIIGQTILIGYSLTGDRAELLNTYENINITKPTKIEKGGDNNDPENPEEIELALL